MTTSADCRFCTVDAPRYSSVRVLFDGYAVTPGHVLVIPVEHRSDYFELTDREREDTHRVFVALSEAYRKLGASGFNIGWNCGEDAGQTIMHAHGHLIPRREGDMADPRGGVRGVIPEKQYYDKSIPPSDPPELLELAVRGALAELRADRDGF